MTYAIEGGGPPLYYPVPLRVPPPGVVGVVGVVAALHTVVVVRRHVRLSLEALSEVLFCL